MNQSLPQTIRLADYQPPAYLVNSIQISIDLNEEYTIVTSKLDMTRREGLDAQTPLRLEGTDLELLELKLDGQVYPKTLYHFEDALILDQVPAQFQLEVTTKIYPQNNKTLEGLYKSNDSFCTQCEPHGFRRITFYPDRPDVMARFETIIEADKTRYPVLLSNGNLIHSEDLPNGRHRACWQDPFPKPSYLFALVAGQLKCLEDHYKTCSGRDVTLRIYVREPDLPKCTHAMRSLTRAMRWDEENYGREYDLDLFMVVAVSDFNQGAMENKGLNIFNSSLVLASQETATDLDFSHIENVIGHEYFHNWSGNRVTCRSWFELSLKEGFTVFRDQSFSESTGGGIVKRIQDIALLRNRQFAEDASPLAHPVRPASYIEINNFYTQTVYNKGAEVVRMLHTMLGAETFRKGTDLYFETFDGQAVTVEDFVGCMERVSGRNLSQFMNWYTQAGTPQIAVEMAYVQDKKQVSLTVQQSCPPTPECAEKKPYHLPFALALFGANGQALPLRLAGEETAQGNSRILELTKPSEIFVFEDISERPVPSLLRNFSAPVKIVYDYSDADLAFLMAHDSDPFNRWDAGQTLSLKTLSRLTAAVEAGQPLALDAEYADAFGQLLDDRSLEPGFAALAITLPSESYVGDQLKEIDPAAIHQARRFLKRALAEKFYNKFKQLYTENHNSVYSIEDEQMAKRSLANVCLSYLCCTEKTDALDCTMAQFKSADNMTDQLAALMALAQTQTPELDLALDAFIQQWQHEPLVVDKWLSIQAQSARDDCLQHVQALCHHPLFDEENPNKIRALIATFCRNNPAAFHDISGAGYQFLIDQILRLNALNPQMAAQLFTPLNRWHRYEPQRRALMRAALERLLAAPDLSANVFEVASKTLQA